MPAIFTMPPSGARLPLRPTTPPVLDRALETGKITSWSVGNTTSAWFSASVLPVTVTQSPCSRPASSNTLMMTGMPPTLYTSKATYFPPGLRSAM